MNKSRNPWKESRVAQILGIRYPIIQGPFGGLSSVRLVADVSNAGGMGSYGAQPLSPEEIKETVAEIRRLTPNPFSINLWVSTFDQEALTISQQEVQHAAEEIHRCFEGLNIPRPNMSCFAPQDFDAQAEALLEARPPVASFVFGTPPKELLNECRDRDIRTMGTATTAEEAKLLEDAGFDLIVASSFEAGGHKGSFLRSPETSLTGMISLIPQVVDSVTIPVIAAGGIAGSRGVAAAFMLGAEAVQVGTAFLVCKGSGINPIHREALLSTAAKITGLTKGFTGRLARGIRNPLFEELENASEKPLPYPLQRSLLGLYSQAAMELERADLLPMWAGQSAPLIEHLEVGSLMQSLTEEVTQAFQQFAA